MKTINILTKSIQETNSTDFTITNHQTTNYILSIPHSGLLIPVEFQNNLNFNQSMLIGTDLFTERIYSSSKSIIFQLNPYLVNVGRSKIIDLSKPKHLQTDPFHLDSLTGEKIMKEEFSSEQKQIMLQYYDQYHQTIQQSIEEMKQKRGFALLFDCHSMNSIGLQNTPDSGKERPDFVIGCLNHTSAHPKIISTFYQTLKQESQKFGWTIMIDHPYSGGYITQKYHYPKNNIHVLQVEIKKSLYMDESLQQGNFEINQDRLKIVKKIISQAFQATASTAQEINTKPL